MIYLNANLAVETFLIMSGLLIALAFFEDRHNLKKLNLVTVLKSYLNRYIRLSAAFFPMILFLAGIFREIGSGPQHSLRMDWVADACEKNWWSGLLYIQNIINPSYPCYPANWYIQVDFQLFLLTPIFIIPLWKFGKKFLWIILAIIVASIAYTFAIAFWYNEVYISYFLTKYSWHRNVLIYFNTLSRASTWFFGVLLGYYLFMTKDSKKLSPKVVSMLWSVSITTIFVTIFAQLGNHTPENHSERYVIAIYQAFHRVGWDLSIGWMIIGCIKYKGPINSFLSHKLWKPIARISYSIYVSHLTLQWLMYGSTKTSQYLSDLDIVWKFCADLIFCTVVGLIWYLLFEAPFNHLCRMYIKQTKVITTTTTKTIASETTVQKV